LLASEYNWTLDQISGLTPRQAWGLIEARDVRRHNEFVSEAKLQCQLHGAKESLEYKSLKVGPDFSGKDIEAMQASMKDTLQKKILQKSKDAANEQHNNQNRRKD